MLRKILNEPLVHFVALGAVLFLIFKSFGDDAGSGDYQIVVSPGRVEHLAAGFRRTWQRPPTEQELQGMIEGFIREEIYYREALNLGLDKDDTIVRRRMNQKLEFLTADAVEALSPTDEDLQAFLQERADTFQVGARIAFRQIFVNPERHGGDANQVARDILERLNANVFNPEQIVELGDRLMLPMDMGMSPRIEIARLFGSEFADELLSLEPGHWIGPLQSGYGLHLVLITERQEPRMPGLDEVREAVKREWLTDRRQQLDQAFYNGLRERYSVEIQMPKNGGTDNKAASATQ